MFRLLVLVLGLVLALGVSSTTALPQWTGEVQLQDSLLGEDNDLLSSLTEVGEDEETGDILLDETSEVLDTMGRTCRARCVYGRCGRSHVRCENKNSAYRLGLRQLNRCRRGKGNRHCPGWSWKCRGRACRWRISYPYWINKLNRVRKCQGTYKVVGGYSYIDPRASRYARSKARVKAQACRYSTGTITRGSRYRRGRLGFRVTPRRRRRRRGLYGRRRRRRRRSRRRRRRGLYGRRRRRRRRRRGLGKTLGHLRRLARARRHARRARRRAHRTKTRARMAYLKAISLRRRALAARQRYARARRRVALARSRAARARLNAAAARLRARMARATRLFRAYRKHVRYALARSKTFRRIVTPYFNSGPDDAAVSQKELDAATKKYSDILELAKELHGPDANLASKRARQALRNQITTQAGRQVSTWIHWLIHNYVVGKAQREKARKRAQRKPQAYSLGNLPPRARAKKAKASLKRKKVIPPPPGVTPKGKKKGASKKKAVSSKGKPWNVSTQVLKKAKEEAEPELFTGHLKSYNPGHAPGEGREADPASSQVGTEGDQWRIATGLEKQPDIKSPHFYPDEQRDTTNDASTEFVKQSGYWNGPDAEFAPAGMPTGAVPVSRPDAAVSVTKVGASKKPAARTPSAFQAKSARTTALGEAASIKAKTAHKTAANDAPKNSASMSDDQDWSSHKEDPMGDDSV